MKKKLLRLRVLLLFLGGTFTAGINAHEFWLEPKSFQRKKAIISFRVGENFSGENWKNDYTKVELLHFLNHNQQKELDASSLLQKPGAQLHYDLPFAGTQTLIYNGRNSFIELSADAFNAYLQEDGLLDVLAWRRQNQKDTVAGKEYYQRSVKTLLQRGKSLTPVNYPTQLPLDIVPLTNPYGLKATDTLRFSIYFRQRQLQQGMVKCWHIDKKGKLTSESQSILNGEVKFAIIPNGKWMVSLVKMVPNQADAIADWQSYWASLTWGYY